MAIDAVESALPDIYWHQTPETWARAKATALAEVDHVDDAMGVYAVLAPLMGHIGEGHLSVAPPQDAILKQRQHGRGLPLDLHWSTDGIFISRAYGEAADLPVGARLLAINGEGYERLLDELTSMIPHDGHIRTGPMREGGGDRYALLRNRRRGDEAVFRVTYQTADGVVVERTVAASPFSRRERVSVEESRVATLDWIEPGLAYLSVPTFSNRVYREAGKTFRGTIQTLFAEIKRGGATRLILDLRENGGGSEPNESVLFSYLVAQPLHKYAAVEARAREVTVTSLTGAVFSRPVFDDDEIDRQDVLPGGRLRRLNVPPEGLMSHWEPSEPVFDGRLVILAGGYTFSGGAELASMLHHVGRGVFVGEEVGGAHEGNTSGYSWDLTLPNSGVRLHVPLLQFRFNWLGLPAHRGVPAQCEVPPLVSEIGVQRDRAWHVARQVIDQDWVTPDQAQCPQQDERT
ncbi:MULTISPECIES: S41 family peptidase [Brevundimonas]|uniref:S41 family peptidase n=1 Tax=Brevundimonas TaxID=41275 RepID=UPI0032088C75